ncbi:putative pseudouridylate synthase I [Trypanosoma vivax]|nr:putative pseudouridylate synthase I [Trypanosoma vivax]
MPKWKGLSNRRACLRKAPAGHSLIGLFVFYCGTAYRGLQIQTHAPTHHTVEGVLIQALRDIGVVESLENGRIAGSAHHLARSCRTDRGVHAVRNVVSLFVRNEKIEAVGGCENITDLMNASLPNTVRVARATHLMGNFIPRFCCNRRVYRYMIPAYALIPECVSWETFFAQFPRLSEVLQRRACGSPHVDLLAEEGQETDPSLEKLRCAVLRGNELLRSYIVGTHRFHNFSVDLSQRGGYGVNKKAIMPESNAAVRTIIRCEIAPRVLLLPGDVKGPTRADYEEALKTSGTSVAESDTTQSASPGEGQLLNATLLPYFVFQIEGRSFLFNMIRKIVGVLLAVLRGARETLFADVLSPYQRAACPLAPGSHLFLFFSAFERYDRIVRQSSSRRFRSIADEWHGKVAEESLSFVRSSILADIVDLDMNRMPAIGTLLRARDAERNVQRPQWREEDSHLASLKTYGPACEAQHPTCSEMTVFLRSLRVHNWSIEVLSAVPVAERGENREDVSRRKRAISEMDVEEEQVVKRSRTERGAVVETTPPQSAVDNDKEGIYVDDGWLYVAPTAEEEQLLAREYNRKQQQQRQQCRKPWGVLGEEGNAKGLWCSDGDSECLDSE